MALHLSVSSNGSTWVKPVPDPNVICSCTLSVSSNGSTWVKHGVLGTTTFGQKSFSILERIDVGETSCWYQCWPHRAAFSILERIDVGETCTHPVPGGCLAALSVSSNGSTWVKPLCYNTIEV